MEFWEEMARLQLMNPRKDRSRIEKTLLFLRGLAEEQKEHRQESRLDVLDQLKQSLLEGDALTSASATAGDAVAVPTISKDSNPGVSLVTCSMNRSENLVKALRSWLPHGKISELIIVDWGSDIPVSDTLRQEGIADPRIRLVRAPNETRWILSYAFNLGFRLAKFDKVLKVDADIVMSPDFFEKNTLIEKSFIAGNWREAEQGQEHVNGFFYVHKSDLAEVGGFNEYITTYGWDDDDLYTRLGEFGVNRENVAPGTIQHLDHSDEERSEDILGDVNAFSAIDEIRNDTMFKIRRNRFIANVMPVWNGQGGFVPLPLTQQPLADGTIEVLREGWIDAKVSHVSDEYFAKHPDLLFERRDHGILWITINRPDKLNATNPRLHYSLSRVWDDIHDDDDTSLVVITGAGRAFSAGGDLDSAINNCGNYDEIMNTMREAADIVYRMLACEKVIISAINGVAVGAGLAVALMADISIMAKEAKITDGHVKIGVGAGDHAVVNWPLLCGLAKAKYYLLTADFIDGETADKIGLVSKSVPGDELLDEAMAVATKLASGAQDAQRFTKRALNLWLSQSAPAFDASLAFEMLNFFGPDAREGIGAFLENRDPNFTK